MNTMPLYSYRDILTGELSEKVVPISERDNQEGLERVLDFKGSVWAPTAGGMR